jgi:hypothetical protein
MAGSITTYAETITTGVPSSAARRGWIVTLSMATGVVAALLLAALPFVPVSESAITGSSTEAPPWRRSRPASA